RLHLAPRGGAGPVPRRAGQGARGRARRGPPRATSRAGVRVAARPAPRALAAQRAVLANASAPLDRRESALEACVLARDPELPALLPALVAEPALRSRAL